MNKKLSLNWSFLSITIVPMLVLGIIISIAGSGFVADSLNKATEEKMIDLSRTIMIGLDGMYPGDYHVEKESDGATLVKGEHIFNNDFEYIDSIKEETGIDVTIFYLNYAVATTLRDKHGDRMVGSGESDTVKVEVLNANTSRYYSDLSFGKEEYNVFYTPICDEDGKAIGMISLAEPTYMVNTLAKNAVIPILLIALVSLVIGCIYTRHYSNGIIDDIRKIQKYMKAVSNGEFRASLGNDVESREDELGDMGRSAVKTALSLRKMVEEDLLTSLLNRRSADKHLHGTMNGYVDKGVKFCLALGDIDFFKKVNDTYGHEAGDKVLIAVSSAMKNFMIGKGYTIRWGGEEFILVFEGYYMDRALSLLEELLNKIRALEIVSGENVIKVTMSFGIVECDPDDMERLAFSEDKSSEELEQNIKKRIDEYINEADARLYYSKQHGRNQITDFAVDGL